ncbi:MAG: exonuclease SbcCD subunit D [Nanoarchaeota archaeon]|nr:exonuclease SbcCD subunit D [Nanoarchaeota archaeon]
MKFAHMADCHIGSWRDPKLKELSILAFERAVDICIEKKVDFILICGDLFNTSLPGIDFLKRTTKKLKELERKEITVYVIPGSHDFSPSGKTILDVLEEAELLINVVKGSVKDDILKLKFTINKKTGTKITGLLGRRGLLERSYYEKLDKKSLEEEPGSKIFMFHTALSELKPIELEKMDSAPISFLPKGFEYYAGGHVHIVRDETLEGYKKVVYPGPLFPANFSELEKLKQGGFYIYNHGKLEFMPINVKNVFLLQVDAHRKTPQEVFEEIVDVIKNHELNNTIVLLRIFGKLKSGKPSDVDFKKIFTMIYGKAAFFVMKNTSKLISEEFEEIKITASSVEEIENEIIKENLGQINTSFSKNEEVVAKKFLEILTTEKKEGEKVYEFNKRIKDELDNILNLNE